MCTADCICLCYVTLPADNEQRVTSLEVGQQRVIQQLLRTPAGIQGHSPSPHSPTTDSHSRRSPPLTPETLNKNKTFDLNS